MLNLTLISNVVNSFVGLLIVLKVFSAYYKHRREPIGQMFADFGMTYLMVTGYFMVSALEDYFLNGFFSSLSHFFLYLAPAYILMMAVTLHRRAEMRQLILLALFLIAIFATVVNLSLFKPSITEIHQGFLFVRADIPIFLRLLDGLIALGASIFAATLFFLYSRRAEDRLTKKRSLLIGLGILLLGLSAILAFFLGTLKLALIIFLGSFSAIPALLLILFGLFYKLKELPPAPATG